MTNACDAIADPQSGRARPDRLDDPRARIAVRDEVVQACPYGREGGPDSVLTHLLEHLLDGNRASSRALPIQPLEAALTSAPSVPAEIS